jgi:hypothetical protein
MQAHGTKGKPTVAATGPGTGYANGSSPFSSVVVRGRHGMVTDMEGWLSRVIFTGDPFLLVPPAMRVARPTVVKFPREVAEEGHLPPLVAATPIDKSVPVKVGQMPGERAEAAKTGQADSVAGEWGMALHNLDARMAQQASVVPGEGVRVTAVKPDSGAERFGVRPGGVILEVNRHKVTSGAEAQAKAKKQAVAGSRDR